MIKAMVIETDDNFTVGAKHVFYVGSPFSAGPYDNSEDHFQVGDIVYLDEDKNIWVKLGLDK